MNWKIDLKKLLGGSIEGQESRKSGRSTNRYWRMESKSLTEGETSQNGEETVVGKIMTENFPERHEFTGVRSTTCIEQENKF